MSAKVNVIQIKMPLFICENFSRELCENVMSFYNELKKTHFKPTEPLKRSLAPMQHENYYVIYVKVNCLSNLVILFCKNFYCIGSRSFTHWI